MFLFIKTSSLYRGSNHVFNFYFYSSDLVTRYYERRNFNVLLLYMRWNGTYVRRFPAALWCIFSAIEVYGVGIEKYCLTFGLFWRNYMKVFHSVITCDIFRNHFSSTWLILTNRNRKKIMEGHPYFELNGQGNAHISREDRNRVW